MVRRYLLDTGPLAALVVGRPAAVSLITPWIQRSEAATSILVYGEVIEYLKGQPNYPARQQELRTLLRAVHPYFLTYSILDRYADIRRSIRRPHGTGLIGDIDTLIAATAMERKLAVVTTDGDFQRVPGLETVTVDLRSQPGTHTSPPTDP